jgi:hypothetical protein
VKICAKSVASLNFPIATLVPSFYPVPLAQLTNFRLASQMKAGLQGW